MPDRTPHLMPDQVAAMMPSKREYREAKALRAIDDLFRMHGWRIDKPVEDITRGIPGLPDRLYTAQTGLQLYVEGKRPATTRNPRGHVRAAQVRWLTEMRRRHVCCLVADSVTQVLQEIAELGSDRRPDVDGHHLRRARLAALLLCDEVMCAGEYPWWPA